MIVINTWCNWCTLWVHIKRNLIQKFKSGVSKMLSSNCYKNDKFSIFGKKIIRKTRLLRSKSTRWIMYKAGGL